MPKYVIERAIPGLGTFKAAELQAASQRPPARDQPREHRKMQIERNSSNFQKLKLLTAALCTAGFTAHAQALPFLDASHDFLPSYTGAKDADLDVLQADVVIDPRAQTITFSGTMKGNIDTRSQKLYVFGVDRGNGAVGRDLVFQGSLGGEPKIGSRVPWDAAAVLTASGQALFFDALNPGFAPLANVPVTITGNQITATLPPRSLCRRDSGSRSTPTTCGRAPKARSPTPCSPTSRPTMAMRR